MDLSIIIPAYQEEENLKILLPKIKEEISNLHCESEVIIVDSKTYIASTEQLCLENNAIYINREGQNNSYGDAIRTGIKNVKGENIIFMDADGSHSPDFIKKLYSYKNDFDVVIASRYINGGSTENNPILILMSRILNITYSLILQINCKDVSNSFKLYKQKDIKNLQLYCNNFDIVEEILYKINKNNKNLKIKEVPFLFKNRLLGKTKRNLFLFILTYIYTIIKLKIGK